MNEIYSPKDCFKKGLRQSKCGVQISHSMEDGEGMPHGNRGDLELLKRCDCVLNLTSVSMVILTIAKCEDKHTRSGRRP